MPSNSEANQATTNIAVGSKNQPALFLGIDGGGSKCKAVLMDAQDNILGSGIAGPGNPLHGFAQAINSIKTSAELALQDAGLPTTNLANIVTGIGLAGVNLPKLYTQMANWQHPFKAMFLTTDLVIACLGAHKKNDGAVMITGTGSCGFSYVDQKPLIIGAHGFPHGDKGSGAWFGLQAAKQVLLSLDGLTAPTRMSASLLTLLNCHSDVDLVEEIANKPATFYAKFANLVFDAAESGDQCAKEIILEGADYINGVATKLWQQKPTRMSMIGGLSPRLISWLAPEVVNKLSPPLSPPEVGAVLFAKQQLAQNKNEKLAV
jgi:glucosamine kinase